MLRSHLFNSLIALERPTSGQDANGYHTTTWEYVDAVQAVWTPQSAGERWEAQQSTPLSSDHFSIRYYPELDHTWRVIHEGRILELKDVKPRDARKETHDIVAMYDGDTVEIEIADCAVETITEGFFVYQQIVLSFNYPVDWTTTPLTVGDWTRDGNVESFSETVEDGKLNLRFDAAQGPNPSYEVLYSGSGEIWLTCGLAVPNGFSFNYQQYL